MELNYITILGATIAQFVLGAVWYSPLMFGRWWMEIMEATNLSKEELQKMQKDMAPLYGLQFLLSLVFTFVLAMFIQYLQMAGVGFHAYGVAGWVWLGFIVPTQIAGVVWANTKKKFWAKQIFVMVSYQLVGMMLAAFILSM
ncbi:MAG: hypothetical protein A3C84_00755 [Candidatus Ryanbacteria bacterium RIFCSPHIGHO2_02_FULL_48_12]|uniref:DUF1761 domain-containing protein n=1 Tax=Candidatus Ryanbacteria bacterium RIFCSPHIGHO2_01_FULL_48_27 TaxID=1802115 RepID=A0A1G2G6G2_9BACT|nr:MAG: hypothetical protein A2756_02675 [Candidatus Ryanbacteria bacterium RIFCSPHIGHO2_01_FULL_48_27]OGZ49311.1 MAG: hypothetical protein A3C84_00755 [Candidatus Ryanbacteria bacterium RIFCSPHIGHO2_02_FULL_48_12]